MGKKLFPFFLIGFLAVTSAIYVFMLGGSSHALLTNGLFLLPPALASLTGLGAAAIYGFSNPHGRTHLLLSLGFIAWFIGEVIWFYLRVILNVDPYPSAADIFYLVGYPLLFAGLFNELRQQKISLKDFDPFVRIVLGFAAVIVGFLVFYFGVFQAFDPSVTVMENLITMSYGLGDLVLIVPAVLILKTTLDYQKGKLFSPWMYLFAGLFLTLVADVLYAVFNDLYSSSVWPYTLIDLFWIAGYLSLAYGFFSVISVIESAHQRLQKRSV